MSSRDWRLHVILGALLVQATVVRCLTMRQWHLGNLLEPRAVAVQLGDPWPAPSDLTCFIQCRNRYGDDCKTVLYDGDSQACTPGARTFDSVWASTPTIPTSGSPGERLHYLLDPELTWCDQTLNFTDVHYYGMRACLYFSEEKKSFSDARDTCADKNSTLWIFDTMEKYHLMWMVVRDFGEDVWLGMVETSVNHVFEWLTGDLVSAELNAIMWDINQPDDWGGTVKEECVEARHKGKPQSRFGLNDAHCNEKRFFICVKPQ